LIITALNLKKHDIKKIAELIYLVDHDTYLDVFKHKDKAISAIEELLKIKANIDGNKDDEDINNDTNSEYVLLKGNEIKGYLQISKGKSHNYFNEILFLLKKLPLSIAYGFIKIKLLDSFVLSKIKEDDFYLAELAIIPNEQNKGFGTFLLNETLKMAKEENFKRVVLDVKISNKNARKLYEKLGFKIFNKRTGRLFNKNRGMYNMEYNL
jgi:ribosomal protein S18 acetylase RimI-like enzyme